jgi:type 1 fimbriae regulatory protein FimB/type 1 fimbriae regulatory protein FimE
VHPLSGRELRAIRRLQREQKPAPSFVFTNERGAPFAPAGFRVMVARLGVAAGLDFRVHPHMLLACLRLYASAPIRGGCKSGLGTAI